mgnify:CR=1 FL=1
MTLKANTPFRWAIFGTGGVARKFVLDLPNSGGHATVVASRNPDTARSFAASLGVDRAVPDYEAAAHADVDAVYIATPPALHEAHALLAIAAGRAVLIEKPFAPDAAAATRIAEAAKAAGVFCMEAMWTRFQPAIETVLSRIQAGALGDVRGLDSSFMAANTPQAGTSLFDPIQGGALLHRGIYPLSLAHHLLGPVDALHTMGRIGETAADEDCVLTLRHTTGAISSIRASLRVNAPSGTVIYGTKGTAFLEGPVYRPTGARIVWTSPAPATTGQAGPRRFEAFRESAFGLRLSQGLGQLKAAMGHGRTHIAAAPAGNGYHYQAIAVRDAVTAGQIEDPRMRPAESIAILTLIDQARAAWHEGEAP